MGRAHSFTQRGGRMTEFQALVYSLWGENGEGKQTKILALVEPDNLERLPK